MRFESIEQVYDSSSGLDEPFIIVDGLVNDTMFAKVTIKGYQANGGPQPEFYGVEHTSEGFKAHIKGIRGTSVAIKVGVLTFKRPFQYFASFYKSVSKYYKIISVTEDEQFLTKFQSIYSNEEDHVEIPDIIVPPGASLHEATIKLLGGVEVVKQAVLEMLHVFDPNHEAEPIGRTPGTTYFYDFGKITGNCAINYDFNNVAEEPFQIGLKVYYKIKPVPNSQL